MDDLLREFLTETNEGIAQLDIEIVKLEQDPNNPPLLSSIFRLVHTIKGTCGFIGLPRLERLAHAGENVLGKFRDGVLPVTPLAVSLILRCMDSIKTILGVLENTEAEPEGSDQDLIDALNAMADGKPVEANVSAEQNSASQAKTETLSVESPAHESAKEAVAVRTDIIPSVDEAGHKESAIASQSIRVSVDLLENLMVIVSELVLTRNQLMQILRGEKDSHFTTPLQRLNQVTSELQEGVMKTRMQPIGNAWSKLPRIIRDLSLELNKKIDLQMIGAETELDRQVLELIKDPLTHMVRNSADHGIELPAERVAAGKRETGTITIHAYHQGGHIIIEIADDGKGLAIDKIKAKAVQNGLATEADLASMSDTQVTQFIFKPGFSTAAKVTSVSGRGVGMDVVKTNIEKIGGTIDLQTTAGKGSRFLIKIPLTLAIVSALIIESGGERFAIPQICVVELVQASATGEYKIERINNVAVLRLRNRLLPLVSLRQILNLGADQVLANDMAFVVVVQVGSSAFGIIVDRVFDTEEIVVKPVAPILRAITLFSGNTILGDGSVVMILDPNGIAEKVGQIDGGEQAATQQAILSAHAAKQEGRQSLLVFRSGEGSPKAVPLSLIARLEEIDLKLVEYSDGAPVVQYRGKLMPLIPLQTDLKLGKEGIQPILVFSDQDRSMGLIVDEIVDIIEDRLQVDLSAKRPGLLGSAIISGKSTDIIDTGYYLSQAYQDWFGEEGHTSFSAKVVHRVLLVDDSPFFRNLLSPLLTVSGYDVVAVENPSQALKLYEEGQSFDAIVSDIEMPEMNGFEFVNKIRTELDRWSKVPVVAISSHTTPRDFENGRQAGFTDYVAKFNREGLLETLQQLLVNTKVEA